MNVRLLTLATIWALFSYGCAQNGTPLPAQEVLDQPDVLFSVGGDLFTWSLTSNVDPWPKGLQLIHLDTDPWQIGKNYPAQVAILGDPKATLPDITAGVGARMSTSAKSAAAARLKSTTDTIKKDREAFRAKARALSGKTPVQPMALLKAIGSMLPKDAVVIEEILSSAPGARSGNGAGMPRFPLGCSLLPRTFTARSSARFPCGACLSTRFPNRAP